MRLPGKGNLNSHGARPVHQIISIIKWIRISRLSMKNADKHVQLASAELPDDLQPLQGLDLRQRVDGVDLTKTTLQK